MRCQEITKKTPKCSCCDLCIQMQNSKCQRNNPSPERIQCQTTDENYFENFAIPDDLYNCKENINRLKSYNERVLQILDHLMKRPCKILQSPDCIGLSEEEEDDELERALQHLHKQKQHSQKQNSPQRLYSQQQQNSPRLSHSQQQHSHSLQKQHSHSQQQHSHSLQQHSHSQQRHSHSLQQQCSPSQQQHSLQQQYSPSQQQHSLQHQSYLQQHQSYQQEQCTPSAHSEANLQVVAPCQKIQNLGYLPQSNFLRNMKRRSDVSPNTVSEPLIQCGCANSIPDGTHYQTQIMCPCCKCNPIDYVTQSKAYGKPYSGHYSDVSSIHDPCTCFRTWRPSPSSGHFPDYQYEVLGREDELCGGGAHIQEFLNDSVSNECKDNAPGKKKGKSRHISRLDKRKRRSGRRRSKPNEEECLPSERDFSPSLKRPHPNSCERCWRYASPSRSPVNRPSQRFDPNYRRSHSEVNINSGSKGDISKSGSRYSSTTCVEFDPENKVHEVISSGDRSRTRSKSGDNVKQSSLVRPASPRPHKRTPKTKDDAEISRVKKEPDVASTEKRKSKHQRSCIRPGESSKGVSRPDRQDPLLCSPSMFDKKGQISNSKKSASNHLSSSESCKENIKIKPRPLSASPIQTPDDWFDKPRAQSFDRSYLRESLCIPPEPMRKCCCTKPKTRMVNMNVMCDQPLFYQGEGGCFPEVRGTFGISNNQENPLGFDKPSPKQDGTEAFFDIRPCLCSFKDLPQLKYGEGFSHCCCPKAPDTLWNRQVISKDEGDIDKKRNSGKVRNKNRKDGESSPRKYCVFYMNKSEENEKDEIEVLIEELTEGKNGKDSKTESLKNKTKKMQEPRSDSMALRFQKGIAEKCRRR